MKRFLFYLFWMILFIPGLNVLIFAQSPTCGTGGISDYIPDNYTPTKTVRVNFWIMQKDDGSGNFQQNDAAHQKMFTDIITIMNYKYGNNHSYSSSDACYSPNNLGHTKIQWSLGNIYYYKNSTYWNNENEVTTYGCPGSSWYLNNFNNTQSNSATGDNVGINVYFTENECAYKYYLLNDPSGCSTYSQTACSQFPTSVLTDNSSVSMRNLFIKYHIMKNVVPLDQANFPGSFWNSSGSIWANDANTYRWMIWDYGGTLAHELGHSLGLPHLEGCSNMMNSGGAAGQGDFWNTNQLATMHRALSVLNTKKYVKESPCNNSDENLYINTGENITWTTGRVLNNPIVVRSGATLTIKCKVVLHGSGVVIVESGGTLILDGENALITRDCCTPLFSYYEISGLVTVKNNATIHMNPYTSYLIAGTIDLGTTGKLCLEDLADVTFVSNGKIIANGITYQKLNLNLSNSFPLAAGNYLALNKITASNLNIAIGSTNFVAGKTIDILPGTAIPEGANFTAYIDNTIPFGCTSEFECISSLRIANLDSDENGNEDRSISCEFSDSYSKKITGNNNLFDCYPNPTSSSTHIRYLISEGSEARLYVTNEMGEEVAVIVENKYHEAGAYEYELPTINMSSGLYFYHLRSGNQLLTKKLSIIK